MKLRKVTAASAAVLALALAATACGSDKKDDSSSSSDGGGGKIKIGIKYDQPGLGLKKPDGSFAGFDVDVATYVAKELGYKPDQIQFVETKSADRENALARGDVKFIAATYSITDKRKAKVDFAGPYLLAHQDLLVKENSTIAKGTDLNGKNLCSVTGSTSAQNVQKTIAPKANLKEVSGYSECLSGLQSGSVDALTTDDSILAGFAAQDQYKGKFKLAGLKLSNENYGIGVKKGDTATVDKINKALEKMVSDGSWEKAVVANFGPAGYKNEPAPKIGNIVK
ncbi:glutamate ABC transporter substrate-binding protein [Streptomyces acidiscabies]|uniref:Glutamate ABC transporter substrate-binding protein n=1 Tax=Streptomyces acidiscabies TaxID=42234 RepID=A0AAP6EF93_9ACTN|nr:glutamate ABC transporter substrate-binding protein [Streptomyces acidiscabies]MBP5936413.1 glutamate ABC transporter substrate-binding protein [Streptomyces sp. LBUM 1476]MBZ3915617.1 glutamate ABC transporter substrate-binding protein [Streptomyces acidiscabies]MDX2960020.1 glutamate ABC transporter substrate-binding protein [Streptomyces acidiscabies]MDX3019371.1 glutamate ABC transporter substrate-binding protein [Streptomyces acidiscabies]MDX3793230.1 glutamate ABC transporter substrat